MRRVALKGLAFRKVRALLTALAVVLGVAMVSGTYVLTDSIQRAFDGIFTGSYQDTSAVISGKQVVEFSTTGKATVPESLLQTVRGVDGVQQAEGAIFDLQSEGNTVKLYNDKGEAAGNGQAPSFGFGFDGDADRFNPLELVDGEWAAGSSQVVIDQGTAEDQGWAIGDRIRAAAEGPAKEFTVSGLAQLGDVQSLGGATLAVFDLSTAQQLLNKAGQLDTIFLASDEGVTPQQLTADIEPLLPASAQVRTGDQQASADSSGISEGVDFIRYFLLAFAAIALAVGSFVIYNTITITLAQRVREFATLRTLGASRKQIMRSVLLEGFALGVLASVIGLFSGVALAKGLSAVFDAMNLSMPQAGLVLATRTIVVSLVLGIGITMLATIIPARRAMAIPPIAAVREGATLPPGRLTRHGWLRPVTAVIAIALLVWGAVGGLDTGSSLLVTALGCVFMFVAFWLVSSRLVVPIASAVGRPSERIAGAAGRLALRNSQRNPVRTARTAAALMIGLALVTLVATLGAGMRGTAEESLDNIVDADYVLTSENGYSTFPAAAGEALAAVDGVEVASSVRSDNAVAFGEEIGVMGMDAKSDETFNVFLVEGSDLTPGALSGDQAIVRESFAEKHDLAIGDKFEITTAAGKPIELTVGSVQAPRSIDKLEPLLAKVAIPQEKFDEVFPRPRNLFSFVEIEGGATSENTAALQSALKGFPELALDTEAGWVDVRAGGLDMVLNLFYVLLALSVIVSLFGMVNTLILSVFERTRELGMLRAVGMTRRQVRRMVRQESVITALIGAAVGLPLGMFLAALVSNALADEGIGFQVPWGQLVAFTIVAIIAGVLAAIVPARRAAKLNVLRALQYE
ncbi:MAG TPA: FtsX-like permease family protein [Solirubrobacteraceae bacterium]|nr:FtsX-like permease family protein [Solirubrobacteraceae bacterium]